MVSNRSDETAAQWLLNIETANNLLIHNKSPTIVDYGDLDFNPGF